MKFLNILYNKIIILSIIAILHFTYSDETFNFQCVIETLTNCGCHTISTASIISDKYLVTSAGSVAVDELQSLLITCCDQNSFLIKAKPNKTIIIHPNFQPDKGLNDVALIKVPKRRLKSDCIKPIPLPCNSEDYYLPRKAAWTTIWITNTTDELPKTRIVEVGILFEYFCQKSFWIPQLYPFNKQNMCGYIKNNNDTQSCSPSHPLVIKDCQKENTLVGITVFARSDCTNPIAAVKLSQFYEWIQNVTKNEISECTRYDCDD